MDGMVLMGVLAVVLLVPIAALTRQLWRNRGEQSPERESDGPPMSAWDGAALNEWAKTNKWEAM